MSQALPGGGVREWGSYVVQCVHWLRPGDGLFFLCPHSTGAEAPTDLPNWPLLSQGRFRHRFLPPCSFPSPLPELNGSSPQPNSSWESSLSPSLSSLSSLPVWGWTGEGPWWARFPAGVSSAWGVGRGCGDCCLVYLELLRAVPGPRASRSSSSQLSRKPGLSAAKQDKNSFSCLLAAPGRGAGASPSSHYSIFVSGSLGAGPETTPTSSEGLAAVHLPTIGSQGGRKISWEAK